jgi:hypothetical protein
MAGVKNAFAAKCGLESRAECDVLRFIFRCLGMKVTSNEKKPVKTGEKFGSGGFAGT